MGRSKSPRVLKSRSRGCFAYHCKAGILHDHDRRYRLTQGTGHALDSERMESSLQATDHSCNIGHTSAASLPCCGRFFGQEGWPSSTVVRGVPSKEDDQSALIDVLQDWKSAHYQELVGEEPFLSPLLQHLSALCMAGFRIAARLLSVPQGWLLLSDWGGLAADRPPCVEV